MAIRKVDEAMVSFGKNLVEVTTALVSANVVPNIQQPHIEYAGAFNDINFNNSFGSYKKNNNLFSNNLINNNLCQQ